MGAASEGADPVGNRHPRGTKRSGSGKVWFSERDGRLLVIDVESGETTELARNDDGEIEDISWSPDSAWLAWSQPGPLIPVKPSATQARRLSRR